MKDSYIIDRNILSILLGLKDEEAMDNAYEDYLNRVNIVIEQAIENYSKEKGLSDERIKFIQNSLLKNIVNEKTAEESLDEPMNKDLKKEIPDELKEKITSLISELNKFIYESYLKKLGEDDKKRLDEYITEMKSSINAVVEFMKTYVKAFGHDEDGSALPPQINLTPPAAK